MPTNCDNEWFVGPVPVTKAYWGTTQVYPCADDPGGGGDYAYGDPTHIRWKPEAVGKTMRFPYAQIGSSVNFKGPIGYDAGDGVWVEIPERTGYLDLLVKGQDTHLSLKETGGGIIWLMNCNGWFIEDILHLENRTMGYSTQALGNAINETSLTTGAFPQERLSCFDEGQVSLNFDRLGTRTNQASDMMFRGTPNFNQDISCFADWMNPWPYPNINGYGWGQMMFLQAYAFNQPLDWITDKYFFSGSAGVGSNHFKEATSFNQDLTHMDASLAPSKPRDFDTGATAWTGIGMGPDRSGRDEGHPEWGRPLWGTTGVL